MEENEFAEIYSRMRDAVFSFAARRLSPEQAKDVVSETFEVVWRKRADAPADSSDWPAWIVGIARNKVLQEVDRVARKHHDSRYLEDQRVVVDRSTTDVADLVATASGGRWVWEQLQPAERELLDLAFVKDVGREEAARILGVTPTAYATRLTRLRQRIAHLDAASQGYADAYTTGGSR